MNSHLTSAALLLAGAAILSFTATSRSHAAVDPGFTYQGELRVSGVPIEGDHDFRFRLYEAETGGSAIGPTLTLDDVPVSEGVFSVFLDFGAAPLASQPRFLEIDVRSSGSASYQTLAPRTRLSTTPYAWAAAVALEDSVDGTSIVAGSVGSDEIDPSAVQRRVANACPGDQFIRQIDEGRHRGLRQRGGRWLGLAAGRQRRYERGQ